MLILNALDKRAPRLPGPTPSPPAPPQRVSTKISPPGDTTVGDEPKQNTPCRFYSGPSACGQLFSRSKIYRVLATFYDRSAGFRGGPGSLGGSGPQHADKQMLARVTPTAGCDFPFSTPPYSSSSTDSEPSLSFGRPTSEVVVENFGARAGLVDLLQRGLRGSGERQERRQARRSVPCRRQPRCFPRWPGVPAAVCTAGWAGKRCGSGGAAAVIAAAAGSTL